MNRTKYKYLHSPYKNFKLSIGYIENELGYQQYSYKTKSNIVDFVNLRWILAYIGREVFGLSFPCIAGILNQRHPTIINALSQVKARMQADLDYANDLQKLAEDVKNKFVDREVE